MINSWDSLSSNLYGVDALIFKWIPNFVIFCYLCIAGVDALIFKWISNATSRIVGRTTGVNTLIFKINLFYNTATTVRVRNDSRALRMYSFTTSAGRFDELTIGNKKRKSFKAFSLFGKSRKPHLHLRNSKKR